MASPLPPPVTYYSATATATATITKNTNNLSMSSLFSKTTTTQIHAKQIHRFKISCNVTAGENQKEPITNKDYSYSQLDNTQMPIGVNVDRRNLLLGLGGLCTTINLSSASVSAKPITAPNISNCQDAASGFDPNDAVRGKNCCPPTTTKPVKEFVFPSDEEIVRIRRPAHTLTPEYVAKFSSAIQAMKNLPEDHPHSFIQQARVHCAYCNGAYTQAESGSPDIQLQIHNSWLFFPFHRWYLYFFERILGKLINDPTFALPFWNWDTPEGMSIPAMFEDRKSAPALFDPYRNCTHLPPAIVDLDINIDQDKNTTDAAQIRNNLGTMYKQMIRNASKGSSFFGGKYKAGDTPIDMTDPSVGSVEAGCHTAVHLWVGDPRMPNYEDLGNFYSAGYDPLFYVHHANVDRLWSIWKLLGGKRKDLDDKDWLDASFVFYDENEDLVRVFIKQSLSTSKLRYDYDKVDIPWLKSRPVARNKKSNLASTKSFLRVKKVEEPEVIFPVKLNKIVKVVVKRPAVAVNRSKEDKEKEDELLLIEGIKFDSEKFVKFDVHVNDEDDNGSSGSESEFAGSFAQLPHNSGSKMLMTSSLKLGLTEVLEDLEAEDDETVLVTLVPRSGCEELTISNVKIALVA